MKVSTALNHRRWIGNAGWENSLNDSLRIIILIFFKLYSMSNLKHLKDRIKAVVLWKLIKKAYLLTYQAHYRFSINILKMYNCHMLTTWKRRYSRKSNFLEPYNNMLFVDEDRKYKIKCERKYKALGISMGISIWKRKREILRNEACIEHSKKSQLVWSNCSSLTPIHRARDKPCILFLPNISLVILPGVLPISYSFQMKNGISTSRYTWVSSL